MTEHTKHTTFVDIFKLFERLTSDDARENAGVVLLDAFRLIVEHCLRSQQDDYLGCQKHDRPDDRIDYRNGYKKRAILTPAGKVEINVPQTRKSGFHPIIPTLNDGSRLNNAFRAAVAEMYLKGVSTRKVSEIVQELFPGQTISAATVIKCAQALDGTFDEWRNRKIDPISILYLDATYIKIRGSGIIRDFAVLIAVGVDSETGRRRIIGVSVSLSEAEEHWSNFFKSLMARGMNRPALVVSDSHVGIRGAVAKTLTGVPWQRCQFHFQQNAQSYVTGKRLKSFVAGEIRAIFNSGNREAAEKGTAMAVSLFREKKQDKLADWLEENIEQCLTIIDCPAEVQRYIRTSNMMECVNSQLKKRTRLIPVFPSEASLLRLLTARLMDLSDEWEGNYGRAYISPEKLEIIAEVLRAAAPQPSPNIAA
ncbi:MAG: IS256 family transposase [Akkermansia muciniphila]|nr:IS256 family transposase [Akkermansia muciniphila]